MFFKKVLFTLLLTLFSGFLIAQDFSIGIKDGISTTSIKGTFGYKNSQYSPIINRSFGHSFGLVFNFRLSNHMLIQTEINYEKKGFDFKSDPWLDGYSYTGNYNIKYITIPAIIQYELGKNVKYYAYSGINFGILVKAENQTSFISTSSSQLIIYDLSYDPADEFNNFELGGIFGLGIKIPLCEKVKFILDLRYCFGLTKATKNTDYSDESDHWTEDTPNNFQDVYNRSLTISLGFIYKIK